MGLQQLPEDALSFSLNLLRTQKPGFLTPHFVRGLRETGFFI
jgi:hypothetical protein